MAQHLNTSANDHFQLYDLDRFEVATALGSRRLLAPVLVRYYMNCPSVYYVNGTLRGLPNISFSFVTNVEAWAPVVYLP